MARLFDDASSQYIEVDSAVVTAVPLSIACWFNADDFGSGNKALVCIGDKDVTNQWFLLRINPSGLVIAQTLAVSAANASSSISATLNQWQHACVVFAGINSRAAYLDGGNKGTNTTSLTPTGIDRTSIGRTADSTPAEYWSNYIAEVGIWNIALSDEDVLMLSKGYSPLLIKPDSLVFYAPLIGRSSPEIDLIGGLTLTVNGATQAEHPRIYYPCLTTVDWSLPAAVAAQIEELIKFRRTLGMMGTRVGSRQVH